MTRRYPQRSLFAPDAPAPKARASGVLEADVQRAVLALLEVHPAVAWAHRMNTGAGRLHDQRTGQPGRFMRFAFKGCADILGQLKDGRLLAIECKSPSGDLSEEQAAFLARVNKHHGVAFVARSAEDVMRHIPRDPGDTDMSEVSSIYDQGPEQTDPDGDGVQPAPKAKAETLVEDTPQLRDKLREVFATWVDIDDQRAALNDQKKLGLDELATMGADRQAVKDAYARYRMDQDKRAKRDQTFVIACATMDVAIPMQGSLFDDPVEGGADDGPPVTDNALYAAAGVSTVRLSGEA